VSLDGKEYAREEITVESGDFVEKKLLLPVSEEDKNANLEIRFTGVGTLTIGALSLMPEGHFRGMRRDVIALMKDMGIKLLRWPGGNFAGEYNWKDGLLPCDMRAPFESYMGLETQPHSMGYDFHEIDTDDFIALCREIGAEPFLTINPTWNTPKESAQWVEYCNGDETTEYGKIRIARGYTQPYNVHFWSLGNEFGYGHMEGDNSAYGYCKTVSEHGKEMLKVFPHLTYCSSGPYPNKDWAENAAKPLTSVAPLVSLHYYGHQPMFFNADCVEEEYYACAEDVATMRQLAHQHRDQLSDDLKISFDEWNVWYAWYRPSSVTDGIYTALAAQMLIAEAKPCGIELACHFEAINEGLLEVHPDWAELTAQGQMFKLMKNHAGGHLVYTAPEAVMTRNSDGVATATVVNASLTEWKDVSFGGCGKCVEAKLYSSDSILPPSYFSESDVLADVKNSTYRMPPHSVLLLRFQA
jgi:alpha-N-arabinofuranosidase